MVQLLYYNLTYNGARCLLCTLTECSRLAEVDVGKCEKVTHAFQCSRYLLQSEDHTSARGHIKLHRNWQYLFSYLRQLASSAIRRISATSINHTRLITNRKRQNKTSNLILIVYVRPREEQQPQPQRNTNINKARTIFRSSLAGSRGANDRPQHS